MSEEQKLARNIQVLSNGKLEARNLDTCMTYGISGLCGKECPKFKDKTCEVYLDTLEKEYNSLQNQLQQKEKIIKEVREYMKSIEHEPDADMYIELGQYKEYKHILEILDKVKEI